MAVARGDGTYLLCTDVIGVGDSGDDDPVVSCIYLPCRDGRMLSST